MTGRCLVVAGLLMAASLLLNVQRAMTVPFDDDEFQHAHMAWAIAHGQTPYVDFFEHHSPAYHLLVSPLFGAVPGVGGLLVLRLISVLFLVGTLLAVFRVAGDVAGWRAGCYAVCLLVCAPFFFEKMVEARPEGAALLCFAGSAALLGWGRSAGRLSRVRLGAIGLLASLGVWLSVKYALIGVGLLVCVLCRQGGRAFMPFVCGALVAGLPVLLWLAGHGALAAFADSVLWGNLGWKHRFSPADYAIQAFGQCGALLSLGVVGLVGGLCRHGLWQRALCGVVLGVVGCAGVVLVPEPFRQAFLPLLVVLAVAAGVFLGLLHAALHGYRCAGLALAVLVFASVAPGLYQVLRERGSTQDADIRLMAMVDSFDPTGGPVFDGRGLMFYRPHVGRHACMHKGILMMLDPDEYAEGVIRALEAADLPMVILDYRVEQMPEAVLRFISNHYRAIPDSPIRLPGLALDRAVLPAGVEARVPVSGFYRARWRGGSVEIDGAPVERDSLVELGAGTHFFKGRGFIEGFELILERRP